jgi:molybdopterin converting factor small subunit
MVRILLSGPLQRFVTTPEIRLTPGSIEHVLRQLEACEGDLFRSMAPDGRLSRTIKIFVNNIAIEALAGYETEVMPGDDVYVVAASSGG